MSELKFRAFNKTDGKMKAPLTLRELMVWGEPLKYDELIITQYTGMKDVNGKEIYEGDILKSNIGSSIKQGIFTVEFRGMAFCFIGITHQTYDTITNENIKEVNDWIKIGNIHENPELLETENAN